MTFYSRIESSKSNEYHCKNCGKSTYGYYIKSSRYPGEFCSEGCARQYELGIKATQEAKKAKNKDFKSKHPVRAKVRLILIIAFVVFLIAWVIAWYKIDNTNPFDSIVYLFAYIFSFVIKFIKALVSAITNILSK